LLLGGEPFAEQIVVWWNFVGVRDESRCPRAWMAVSGFGESWLRR